MLSQCVILRSQRLLQASRVICFYSTKTAKDIAEQMVHFDKRLPLRIPKQEKKAPFLKNLLIGSFDSEMMAFHEAQDTDRNKAFFKWLQPIEDYMQTIDVRAIDETMHIPDEVIDRLNEFGVFASIVAEDYGGIGLIESEYMKLLEVLARVPAIALLLMKINRCVQLIEKHASPEQKIVYLPRIANTSIIPTYCVSEPKSDNPKQIRSMAIFSEDDKSWILQGDKIFVPFADRANLFVTFANCMDHLDEFSLEKTLSILLIDKNSPGISISKAIETVGIRGLPHHNVTFQEVKVPVDNMMGKVGEAIQCYTEFMSSRKHDTGAVAIGILRNFINTLTHYMTHTQHFNKRLYEFDTAKEVLGKACHALFAMESVTYMTTALMDLYNDQDLTMESCIVQNYCATECVQRLSEGIALIGTPAYLKENPYDLFYRDAHALTIFESSMYDNETFVSLLGLQYVGQKCKENIFKLRNPFDFPLQNFLFRKRDRFLNLRVRDFLHPSLNAEARHLEKILFNLKESTMMLMVRYGAEVANSHMDLRRYYELAAIAYVYASILSRASRSYCIGLRNSDEEIRMATTIAYKFFYRANVLFEELSEGQFNNGDVNYAKITEKTLECKKYLAEHPLKRNF